MRLEEFTKITEEQFDEKAGNLGLTEAREIEFMCVNPDFCDATEQKNQDALFRALKQVPGIIVYRQDFDIHNSMAAVLKSTADRNTVANIKRLAKQHNVGIDLEQQISDKRVDAIYTGDLQGLIDWYDTDNLNQSSAIKESLWAKYQTLKEGVLEESIENLESLTEAQFDEAAGEKDACYHKVKSRYKVWPSAYASGALVQCRKVGAKNWGNKSKK